MFTILAKLVEFTPEKQKFPHKQNPNIIIQNNTIM
jgi:hypothetical protein